MKLNFYCEKIFFLLVTQTFRKFFKKADIHTVQSPQLRSVTETEERASQNRSVFFYEAAIICHSYLVILCSMLILWWSSRHCSRYSEIGHRRGNDPGSLVGRRTHQKALPDVGSHGWSRSHLSRKLNKRRGFVCLVHVYSFCTARGFWVTDQLPLPTFVTILP